MSEPNVAKLDTPETAPAAPSIGHPDHYVSSPVDICETAAGSAVVADMPGASHDNLEVSVVNHALTIKGHVTQRLLGKECYHELKPVSILRRFRLDGVFDAKRVKAELRNGVLQLHIPKAKAIPRQNDIRVT